VNILYETMKMCAWSISILQLFFMSDGIGENGSFFPGLNYALAKKQTFLMSFFSLFCGSQWDGHRIKKKN